MSAQPFRVRDVTPDDFLAAERRGRRRKRRGLGKVVLSDPEHTRSPYRDSWIIRRVLAGWHPTAIQTAVGVSRRTAQRWRAESDRLEQVTVGGYVATFLVRKSKPPVRISAWSSPVQSGLAAPLRSAEDSSPTPGVSGLGDRTT